MNGDRRRAVHPGDLGLLARLRGRTVGAEVFDDGTAGALLARLYEHARDRERLEAQVAVLRGLVTARALALDCYRAGHEPPPELLAQIDRLEKEASRAQEPPTEQDPRKEPT